MIRVAAAHGIAMIVRMKLLLALIVLAMPLTARAEGERELLESVARLSRTSYRWEKTVRQRFKGEAIAPRLTANAPAEARGSTDPRGFTQITLLPSRELAAEVTAVFREGDVVAQTPLGWLRRSGLRQPPGGDRDVVLDGKKVRLGRLLSVALKATAMRPGVEEVFDLLAEMKTCRREQGLFLVELRDATVEQLWGGAEARRAPEIQGTVICKVGDEGLMEYHVVLGIGFPNSRTKKIDWSMQQWSGRFSGVGTTTVEPPAAARAVLDSEP